MSDSEEKRNGYISLEDQAFLKELGISGLSQGAERALQLHREALAARGRIEARAEGLRSLDLDRKTIEKLAKERSRDPDDLQEDLGLFRDLEKP